jgi:iron(III) transport system ATP-binding protein
MNEGVVEQIGTPAEVYARPTTMFVADFIGNMTFLSGSVKGPARVSVAAIELSCPAVNGLAPGTPVRVGLRPEEVRIRGIEPGTPNQLSVRIKALHYLGSFCRATLEPETAPGVGITSDFSANAVRDLGIAEGQTIPIVLPEEALRVFPVQETAR